MTQHIAALSSITAALGHTLADVMEKLAAVPEPKAQSVRNKISAINVLCKVLDCRPCDVPIAGRSFRARLGNAAPGAFHLSRRRWTNILSDIRGGIRLSGLTTLEPQLTVPLGDVWLELMARLKRSEHQGILRRFGRYCALYQVMPAGVDDGTVERYLEYLNNEQVSRAPQKTMTSLIRVWNESVVPDAASKTRALSKIVRKETYGFTWSELPAPLAAEAAAFKASSLKPDPFDEDSRRAVAVATAEGRDRLLRRVASAAILAGLAPSEVDSLKKLFSPPVFKQALAFFWNRNGQKPNAQIALITQLALVIAQHWVKASEAEVQELKRLAKKLKRTQSGMTDKNRERLAQFRDQGVVQRLLELPDILMAEAERRPDAWFSARLAETAVAIAILIHAPVRLKNLASLDRQRHFKAKFSTKDRSMLLVIDKAEVKNVVDLEFPIDAATMRLIDRYMAKFQPILDGGHAGSLLFPSPSGGSKRENNLRGQITGFIWKRLGIAINPHLFRHLAGMIFLEAHPGQYEQVRRLLGHKNLTTTITFYAGLETRSAADQYHRVVLRARGDSKDDEETSA